MFSEEKVRLVKQKEKMFKSMIIEEVEEKTKPLRNEVEHIRRNQKLL